MFWTVVIVLAVAAAAYAYTRSQAPAKPNHAAAAGLRHGVVHLNQMPRTTFSSNASPFCVKLETWLRMANVPYSVMPRHAFSSKGKNPWIAYNGVVVEDSSLAVAYLSARPELNVTLDAHLTAAERGVAHAFKVMCDEELYWGVVYTRWTCNPRLENYLTEIGIPVPGWVKPLLGQYIAYTGRQNAKGHGIGRHSLDDLFAVCERDAQAVADQLSDGRAFLMGARACSADAAVYAHLQALLSPANGTLFPKTRLVLYCENLPVLKRYVDRVQATFWPDWADFLKPNGAKAFP